MKDEDSVHNMRAILLAELYLFNQMRSYHINEIKRLEAKIETLDWVLKNEKTND